MLRFFRKIRQQYVQSGAFSKYLMYAVGEIALVVIGILLALAITNANEDRLTRNKEHVYLQGLQRDFMASRMKLVELLRVNEQNYAEAKRIANYMSNEEEVPTEQELSELLFQAFAYDISFNPNNSLLAEMISSGSLKDLSNAELRKQLTNWNAFLDDIARQEADLRDQREKLLDIFREDQYHIRTVLDQVGASEEIMGLGASRGSHSNLDVLNSTAFENSLMIFILTSILTETEHYQPLLVELDAILTAISSEVEE